MKDKTFLRLFLIAGFALAIAGCRKEPLPSTPTGYPEAIEEILVANCANVGCHDDNSFEREGRLSLSGWDAMFKGSRSGAAVVPYRTDQSYLLFFANTFPELGIVQTPTMPLGGTPLTKSQMEALNDWVALGAPNADGEIKWADNANRSRLYIVNQGCDQVAVLDRDTRLVMRYVDIGIDPLLVESPHYLRISPDGKYWYVVYLQANNFIEKYETATDKLVGRVEIGEGSWNTFALSPDGNWAFSVDIGGQVAISDVQNMVPGPTISLGNSPHGSVLSPDGTKLYVTEQYQSDMHVVTFGGSYGQPDNADQIDMLQSNPDTGPSSFLGIHEVLFTPDGDRYAITCQFANQVRFYDASNDSLLQVIPVGAFPSELDYDEQSGLLFVTCSEDVSLFPGDPLRRGSVAVIDYNSMTLVKSVYSGYQPHGVEVDAERRLVYIGNRNANATGPAPHHTTECGGRNGYVTAIDINTLELLEGFKHELSVDPYAMALKK